MKHLVNSESGETTAAGAVAIVILLIAVLFVAAIFLGIVH